jgi:hypothetical protein
MAGKFPIALLVYSGIGWWNGSNHHGGKVRKYRENGQRQGRRHARLLYRDSASDRCSQERPNRIGLSRTHTIMSPRCTDPRVLLWYNFPVEKNPLVHSCRSPQLQPGEFLFTEEACPLGRRRGFSSADDDISDVTVHLVDKVALKE